MIVRVKIGWIILRIINFCAYLFYFSIHNEFEKYILEYSYICVKIFNTKLYSIFSKIPKKLKKSMFLTM